MPKIILWDLSRFLPCVTHVPIWQNISPKTIKIITITLFAHSYQYIENDILNQLLLVAYAIIEIQKSKDSFKFH